jgi:hypothetical protein
MHTSSWKWTSFPENEPKCFKVKRVSPKWTKFLDLNWTIVPQGPCHSSGDLSLTSHRGVPGSIPVQVLRIYGAYPSIKLSLTNSHSLKYSTLIIVTVIYHWGCFKWPTSDGRTKWTQTDPLPRVKIKVPRSELNFYKKTKSVKVKTCYSKWADIPQSEWKFCKLNRCSWIWNEENNISSTLQDTSRGNWENYTESCEVNHSIYSQANENFELMF